MTASDIKDAGPLAGVVRYGVPWHGRIEAGVLHTGKLDALGVEVTRVWLQPDSSDCWLIRAPRKQTVDGVTTALPGTVMPDPYINAADAKMADALAGKELTSWALLGGAGNIHGKAFARSATQKNRWLWVDSAGDVFEVRFGLVAGVTSTGERDYDGFDAVDYAFSSAITARFSFRRYGRLLVDGAGAPTVVVDHVIDPGTLGQSSPELTGITGGNLMLRDLSPTGARAIMEVHSLVFDTARNRTLFDVAGFRPFASHRECSNPLGFIEFTLAGTGAAPVVSFSVLATRAQALGTYANTRPAYSLTSALVCDLCADGSCWYACSYTETSQTVYAYTGRIISYLYDAAGTAQPCTMDQRTEYNTTRVISPVTTVSGSSTVDTVTNHTAALAAGANRLEIARAVTEHYTTALSGTVCSTTAAVTWTTDAGVPEWASSTSTSSPSGGSCGALQFDFPAAAATCGSSCRTPAVFTPANLVNDAFILPSSLEGGMEVGVFRFGSGLLSLFGGRYFFPGMGSTGLINASYLQKSYVVWNANRTVFARIYGAFNPATSELAWPKTGPVNFA